MLHTGNPGFDNVCFGNYGYYWTNNDILSIYYREIIEKIAL